MTATKTRSLPTTSPSRLPAKSGRPDELLSLLREYKLPTRFPDAALAAARACGTHVQPSDILGRVDCRKHLVITIDPADARDFDDAFHLRRSNDGGWRLFVHVADVAHYVKPGSALDVEAKKRGNSTYLVDRVVPMLPEALSNGLCSLVPDADRLTNCVEFHLADDGSVLGSLFHRAVIHSRRRYTYDEASAALAREPSDAIAHMLHDANTLARRLRDRRFRAGALAFEMPEMKVRLDDRGRMNRIERIAHDGSHELIEEFMLLANEAVAARLHALRRPALHRIHEAPEATRLREYRADVIRAGVKCGDLGERAEVQRLLSHLDSVESGATLRMGFIRALPRARYDSKPLGHYGLAKDQYTHFTSPIRRYADLIVHRALFTPERPQAHDLAQLAIHVSETEHNSTCAERDSRALKIMQFMDARQRAGHVDRYRGIVTNVMEFGTFVEVPSLGISGLVPTPRRTTTGEAPKPLAVGTSLDVEVERVDLARRRLVWRVVENHEAHHATVPRPPRSTARLTPRR